jgi:L-threonylcarbamoyladenylate synthase
VGIRIPSHPLLQKLLHKLDFPLAAPSANPFGYISPTTSLHVYEQLHGKLHYILEGGPSQVGVESTIVGFEEGKIIVYRPGGLPIEKIESVVGKVILHSNESSNPVSPGMLKSHYAPLKELRLYNEKESIDPRSAIIGFNQYIDGINKEQQYLLSPEGNTTEAASKLFSIMRMLDQSKYSLIYAVNFPNEGLGVAINDRLKRAAADRPE